MGDINTTLQDVGAGMGGLFEAIDSPLGTLLIVIGVATGVVAIFMSIAIAIRKNVA